MKQHEDGQLSDAIRSQATRHELPPALRGRIVTALHKADKLYAVPPHIALWASLQHKWLGWSVAFACGVLASVTVSLFYVSHKDSDSLAQQIVASHVRSLMVAHLSDVVSTDQHTVKPWFNGKLDYSPPVIDLGTEGFPLIGGRLDYFNQRQVAALVYHRHQHTINLFVWPDNGPAAQAEKLQVRQGYNLSNWNSSGMQFWAVSDVNTEELQEFSKLLRLKLNK
ncbi:MAG: anti-sigma factor family protein [Gallionellaceae bacterium]|jgi:anti-sigma factor RsiW